MADSIEYNTRIYTDIQGLSQIKYNKDQNAAKKEVAHQFEALFMQMVLRSMRDASKAFSSDLFGSNQMLMYQEMFDKQLSLTMSNSHIGLADFIEKNLDRLSSQQLEAEKTEMPLPPHHVSMASVSNNQKILSDDYVIEQQQKSTPTEKKHFSSPEEFIKQLWNSAKTAAKLIGAVPEALLAQAALETNWGKSILQDNGESSHNLFNIKADPEWKDKTTPKLTLEQRNGVLVKEKASFRNYPSYLDSFLDYTRLLKNNGRYQEVLEKGSDPKQFFHALQNAGYATDEKYAEKILKLFSSPSFKSLINKVKNI